MIDTIFYFCPTQEEYDRTADTSNGGQGISDKTITFVEDVREIYLNGKGYGKTSTAGLVSDDRLTSTIAALQESLNNTILQTNTNLDAVEADLLQQLTTAETGIQNTIATLRSDTEGAISRLKTEVLDDVDEGFVAKANLDTYVTNAVKDGLGVSSLADVALKSDITSSEATISTRFQTVEGDVSTLQGGLTTTNSSLATLQAQSDADHAKIAAVADWSGWVEGQPVSFNGGLITQANADGVIAGLIANSSSDVAAAVSAQVTRGTSNITLSADKIYLDANTTLANTILATQGNIAGFTISNNSLSASLGDYSIELTPYHFATFKNSTLTNEIKSDGSGSIASGGITWNNNGTITLSQEFLRSLFSELHNGAVNLDTYGGINETFTIYKSPTVNDKISLQIDNIQDVYDDDQYFQNSLGYRPLSLTNLINALNLYATIDYPYTGTLGQKQDWWFKVYDIVGTFLSGILTNKKYLDPSTQLEKNQIPELYMDHYTVFGHITTLHEFAIANSLDADKFLGCIGGSFSSGQYSYVYLKYRTSQTITTDHNEMSLFGDMLMLNNPRTNWTSEDWNYFAFSPNLYSNAPLSIRKPVNLYEIEFVYNTNSSYPDIMHTNILEGSWVFLGHATIYIEDILQYQPNNTYANGNAYRDNWVGKNHNQYIAKTLNNGRTVRLTSINCYPGGIILKYTNGLWTVVSQITEVPNTLTQYRGDETE